MAVEVDRGVFEFLVDRAIASIPAELKAEIENVAILVVDDPPNGSPNLLGLYHGIPLTRRGPGSYAGVMPDTITIYRNPTLRSCNSLDEVTTQVRVTVVHEVGHYFGLDDDRLHELGWG